jgi:hypothetical protein
MHQIFRGAVFNVSENSKDRRAFVDARPLSVMEPGQSGHIQIGVGVNWLWTCPISRMDRFHAIMQGESAQRKHTGTTNIL